MKISTPAYLLMSIMLLAFASVVIFVGLGRAPLWDYDEASYAQITHGMLEHQAWISQEYFHGPFLEKPPLYAWLAAGSARVFGEGEFALRLPSALAGIALVAATLALTYALTQSMFAALLAGCVLLGMSPVVGHPLDNTCCVGGSQRDAQRTIFFTFWDHARTCGDDKGSHCLLCACGATTFAVVVWVAAPPACTRGVGWGGARATHRTPVAHHRVCYLW